MQQASTHARIHGIIYYYMYYIWDKCEILYIFTIGRAVRTITSHSLTLRINNTIEPLSNNARSTTIRSFYTQRSVHHT